MQRSIILLLISVLAVILQIAVSASVIGRRLEFMALDQWFDLRGRIEPPKDVVVVAMDELSYRALDLPANQAWPRKLHARLIEKLHELGAKRVVFDVLFLDASADPEADRQLAAAAKLVPVFTGVNVLYPAARFGGTAIQTAVVERPYEELAKNVAGLGLVGFPLDLGYVRHFNTPVDIYGELIPTLAQRGAGVAPETPKLPGGRDLIWHYGPRQTIRTFPYSAVVDPESRIRREEIENKIVFVGLEQATALGPTQKDEYLTPFTEVGNVFGVEIHATATANMLEGMWLTRLSPWAENLMLGVITFIVCFTILSVRPHWAGFIALCTVFAWMLGAYGSFRSGLFLPGMVICIVIIPLCYIGGTLYYYFTTRSAQLKAKRAFEYYLSPEMAAQIASNPEATKLGGEGAYATALFTDIEGFTSITEKMLPEDVATMLNSYFTEVMDVIFDNRGTLIKFIGDAVFALYGAPIKVGDHALRACQTALAIQREVERFNQSGRFPRLATRIGIHTGPMVVGNLGSARRFDYTAIGDSVNLASRVEGINKYFGTTVLITEAVRRELRGGIETVSIGTIQALGKLEAVELFTILDPAIDKDLEERWLRALREFRKRRWDAAEGLFARIREDGGSLAGAAKRYETEIAAHRASEPPEDWEGAISLKGK